MKLKNLLCASGALLLPAVLIGQTMPDAVVLPGGKSTKELRVSAMLQFQYQNMGEDLDGQPGVGDNSSQNGFYFRRMYLGVQGYLQDNIYGKMVLNFAGSNNNVDMQDAVIGWDAYQAYEVRVGQAKVPFGYEETSSASSGIKTIERSISNRLFADHLGLSAYHQGIFLDGDLSEVLLEGLSYSLSFTSNEQARQDRQRGDDNGFAAFGRVRYNTQNDYGKWLFGVDGGFVEDRTFGAQTEDVMLVGAHTKWEWENFGISAEILGAEAYDVKAAGTQDAFFYGYTVQPYYKINEEFDVVVSYSAVGANGMYMISPDELVRRSNATNADYDEGYSLYFGGNWYIQGHDVKLSAGYEFAHFEDRGAGALQNDEVDISGLRVQMQLRF